MLRGPQTPGELKQRASRPQTLASLDEVETALAGLIARGLVERSARRPGQKEVRYRQLLGGDPPHESTAIEDPGLSLHTAPGDRVEEVLDLLGERPSGRGRR